MEIFADSTESFGLRKSFDLDEERLIEFEIEFEPDTKPDVDVDEDMIEDDIDALMFDWLWLACDVVAEFEVEVEEDSKFCFNFDFGIEVC